MTAAGMPAHAVPPPVPRPAPAPLADSPAIAELAGELRRDGEDAVGRFWNRVAAEGAPLVESAGGGDVIATFLWRGHPGTRAVLARVNKLTDRRNPAASAMHRVPGTDVWWLAYRLASDWRGSYQFAVDDGRGALPRPEGTSGYYRALMGAAGVEDPLNPHRLAQAAGAHKSVASMPQAPPQHRLVRRPGTPRGAVRELRCPARGGERRVWVHTPAGYDPSRRHRLLVLLDGDMWFGTLSIAAILDNLAAEGAIGPTVAVGVDARDRVTRAREMTCDDGFADFIADTLVPWAGAKWSLDPDPAAATIAGQSLGGLAAAYIGHRAPHRFGAVLAQSGSFWWRGVEEAGTRGVDPAASRMAELVRGGPCSAVRFHLQVGTDEWLNLPPTRTLRDALRERGRPVEYVEFSGGHDRACWRVGIAQGLIALQRRV